jgi:hypothetical protein
LNRRFDFAHHLLSSGKKVIPNLFSLAKHRQSRTGGIGFQDDQIKLRRRIVHQKGLKEANIEEL